jgi:hypothetical protein
MNASANIIVEHKENVLTLPTTSVQKMKNRSFVYVKGTSDNSEQRNSQQQAVTRSQSTINSSSTQISANNGTTQSQTRGTNKSLNTDNTQKNYSVV